MTPRECLQLQVTRQFLGTFGCRSHEIIAARILLKLAIYDRWDIYSDPAEYQLAKCDSWHHNHFGFDDETYPCSFDKYVTYTNEAKTHFQVNQRFIDNVHTATPVKTL